MSDHPQSPPTAPARTARTRATRLRGACRASALIAAVTLLGATAACGNGGSGGGSSESGPAASTSVTGDTPSSSPSSSAGTAPSTAPTATGLAPATPGGAAARCTANDLGLGLGPADVGAGNIRFDLQLINKGTSACTLQGFPGVSLLRDDGSTIGVPATWEGGQQKAVALAPGGSAHATLHTLNKGIKGTDCWPAPSLLKVFPPDLKDALTLRTTTPVVCGDTFTVTALQAR